MKLPRPQWPPVTRPDTAGGWRRAAQHHFERLGIDTAALDARYLAEDAFGLSREALLLQASDAVDPPKLDRFLHLVAGRSEGVPVGRLLGWREFWGLRFALGPDTLEPRPDSETLVEQVLAYVDSHGPGARARPWTLLDLGTGTGCLALSLLHELPNATATATDLAPGALAVAAANAAALGLAARCRFVEDDWNRPGWPAGLPGTPCTVLISNPPYLTGAEIAEAQIEVRAHDPHLALDGGADGMAPYRRILPAAASRLLSPGGAVAVEIGSTQGPALCDLAATVGLDSVRLVRDLGGNDRVILGIRSDSAAESATKKTVAPPRPAG